MIIGTRSIIIMDMLHGLKAS